MYGHANGRDDRRDGEGGRRTIATLGYKAIRAQCGIPGLASTYGVGRGTMQYEPAEKGLPPESLWSTEKYLNFVPELFARLRKEFGDDLHLLHDVHHRCTPIEAARLGRRSSHITCSGWRIRRPPKCRTASALIRQHTTTPIAVGEVFNTIYDCQS